MKRLNFIQNQIWVYTNVFYYNLSFTVLFTTFSFERLSKISLKCRYGLISISNHQFQLKTSSILLVPRLLCPRNPQTLVHYTCTYGTDYTIHCIPLSMRLLLHYLQESRNGLYYSLYPSFNEAPPTLSLIDQYAFRSTGSTTAALIHSPGILSSTCLQLTHFVVMYLDFW